MKVKKFSLAVIAVILLLILGIGTISQAATPSASEWTLPVYFGKRAVKEGSEGNPALGYSIGNGKDLSRHNNLGFYKV